MGIAIPQFIIESKNNIWVLGLYGLIFGVGLPILVGRWWFGSRNFTKDGVQTRTAELFFKSIKEDIGETDLVSSVGNALPWERPIKRTKGSASAVNDLRQQIVSRVGRGWVKKVDVSLHQLILVRCKFFIYRPTDPKLYKLSLWSTHISYGYPSRTIIYSKVIKLLSDLSCDLNSSAEQKTLLLHAPSLLNSLLNIALAHSWLLPTVRIMHLHAHLAQAILPGAEKMIQFPGIDDSTEDIPDSLEGLIERLEETGDHRLDAVKKTGEKWGRLEVVDASYKGAVHVLLAWHSSLTRILVIGERFVTPGAIVQLVFKLRLRPPVVGSGMSNGGLSDVEKEKQDAKFNDERDQAFLVSKKDIEDLPVGEPLCGWAHAPRWPAVCAGAYCPI